MFEVSFDEQNIKILIQSYLSILSFVACVFGVIDWLIFDKRVKTIQWGEKSLQQMMLGELDITCKKKKKNAIIPYLTLYTKFNSKRISIGAKIKILRRKHSKSS